MCLCQCVRLYLSKETNLAHCLQCSNHHHSRAMLHLHMNCITHTHTKLSLQLWVLLSIWHNCSDQGDTTRSCCHFRWRCRWQGARCVCCRCMCVYLTGERTDQWADKWIFKSSLIYQVHYSVCICVCVCARLCSICAKPNRPWLILHTHCTDMIIQPIEQQSNRNQIWTPIRIACQMLLLYEGNVQLKSCCCC